MLVRGAAYSDYDRDGDLDLLVVENGGPAHLLRNDSKPRPAIRILLEGTSSNRDGLGARVELATAGVTVHRRVRTGSSYLSRSELALTFALPGGATADSLVVRWPSGHVDRVIKPRAGELVVVEGSAP
jgi:hypothetical protein